MLKIGKKRIIIYVAVVGLLIFLYAVGLFEPVENFITSGLNPVFKNFYFFSSNLRSEYNDQIKKGDFLGEIDRLKTEVNRLSEENVRLATVDEENKVLREHLRFLEKNEYNYILGNVISRGDMSSASGIIETIIIDKGEDDGVYAGLSVVSGKGIIVGKVANVKDNLSEVYLTNSNRCKLAANILGDEERVNGIAEGELGLTVKMNFIPQSLEIKNGDMVVTSGLEQSIPRGLVIGKVIEVSKESNDLWQSATIDPLENPDDLIIVSVLIP